MERAEEAELARRLVRMDEAAWTRFCRDYAPSLLRYVRWQFALGEDEAQDVLQRTLVRCVRAIASYDATRGALFTWLKAVARNEALSLLRAQGRGLREIPASSFGEEFAEKMLETLDQGALASELLARRDLQLAVQDALMELAPRWREALLLKYVEELRVAQIAARLGESESAVASLLARAREAFRRIFETRLREAENGEEVKAR